MKLPEVPQRTTVGLIFPDIERALSDCLGQRKFGAAEKAEVAAFFGNSEPTCVFCGTTNVTRWDHLVSIYQGGETVLGNMVLSCAPCDNSKGKHPFDAWMRSTVPGSPASRGIVDIEARIDRLRAYVAHYNYTVQPLEERLDAEERAVLAGIREKLQGARAEAEALIAHYRARTGHG